MGASGLIATNNSGGTTLCECTTISFIKSIATAILRKVRKNIFTFNHKTCKSICSRLWYSERRLCKLYKSTTIYHINCRDWHNLFSTPSVDQPGHPLQWKKPIRQYDPLFLNSDDYHSSISFDICFLFQRFSWRKFSVSRTFFLDKMKFLSQRAYFKSLLSPVKIRMHAKN